METIEKDSQTQEKKELSNIAVTVEGEIKKFDNLTDLIGWAQEQNDPDVSK